MITCHGLVKRYSGRTVLDDLDLRIGPGVCALLGPNGAGKSTLLRILMGLERPDGGTVEIGGMRYGPADAALRRRLGALPDGLGLFEPLTVLDNLCAIGPVYGLTRRQTEERAFDLLDLLEMRHGQLTAARDCSFGMRKKTALAMALLHGPDVLLLDEPFEGIDPASSAVIERLLRQRAAAGATILLTTHLLPVVETLADRLLILNQGRVAFDAAPSRVPGSVREAYFSTVGSALPESPAWLSS